MSNIDQLCGLQVKVFLILILIQYSQHKCKIQSKPMKFHFMYNLFDILGVWFQLVYIRLLFWLLLSIEADISKLIEMHLMSDVENILLQRV